MALEYINIDIIKRISKRFDIRYWTNVVSPFILGKVVTPVTDFDKILEEPDILSTSGSIVSAALVIATVPEGKRWLVIGCYKQATTGNTLLYIDDGTDQFNLTANNAAEAIKTDLALPMKEGWTVQMGSSGNAGDANRTGKVFVIESDAYQG